MSIDAMKERMSGATKEQKDRLHRSVDAPTYKQIQDTAVKVLDGLPKDVPLGTLTAALMLAATAFAEGASHAERLIKAD